MDYRTSTKERVAIYNLLNPTEGSCWKAPKLSVSVPPAPVMPTSPFESPRDPYPLQSSQGFGYRSPTPASIGAGVLIVPQLSPAQDVQANKERIPVRQLSSPSSPSRGALEKTRRQRTKWTLQEDQLLLSLVEKHGATSWNWMSRTAFNGSRSGDQLRARYRLRLHPERAQREWSAEEDAIVLRLQTELGNAWKDISTHLQGRMPSDVMNRFGVLTRRFARNAAASS
mmetsp:Transcript_10935/g.23371  ORF Transcript_10935/g.23371 Transcript_10935/m.23371 type:complete len:227 (-) Transcript_10935:1323-2003(-)